MSKKYILTLDDADHKLIKIIAAQENTTMRMFILAAIQHYIDTVIKPDKNT